MGHYCYCAAAHLSNRSQQGSPGGSCHSQDEGDERSSSPPAHQHRGLRCCRRHRCWCRCCDEYTAALSVGHLAQGRHSPFVCAEVWPSISRRRYAAVCNSSSRLDCQRPCPVPRTAMQCKPKGPFQQNLNKKWSSNATYRLCAHVGNRGYTCCLPGMIFFSLFLWKCVVLGIGIPGTRYQVPHTFSTYLAPCCAHGQASPARAMWA